MVPFLVVCLKVTGYTFRASNSVSFNLSSLQNGGHLLIGKCTPLRAIFPLELDSIHIYFIFLFLENETNIEPPKWFPLYIRWKLCR